jgi:hypothetical protein
MISNSSSPVFIIELLTDHTEITVVCFHTTTENGFVNSVVVCTKTLKKLQKCQNIEHPSVGRGCQQRQRCSHLPIPPALMPLIASTSSADAVK